MGDMVYPSVMVKGAPPNVTKSDIISYFKRILTCDHSKLEIKIFKNPPSSARFIVSAINLSLDEIRKSIGFNQLGGRQIYVHTPDFGCHRDDYGALLNDFYEVTHGRLRASQGALKTIDVFNDDFRRKFGKFQDLSKKIYYDSTKASINPDVLNKCGFRLQYGQVPGRIASNQGYQQDLKGRSMKDGTLKNVAVEIEYVYTSEALQAICWHNNQKELCPSQKQFITSSLGQFKCKLPGKQGLRHDGELLAIKRVMDSHSYLPLTELNQKIFSLSKIQALECICFDCSKKYRILGVGPDLNWLAAVCGCFPIESPFTWYNENFFRMFIPYQITRAYNKYEGDLSSDSNDGSKFEARFMVKLCRGLLTSYSNVNEFKQTALAAHHAENMHKKEWLFDRKVDGTLEYFKLIETTKVREILVDRCILHLVVKKSSLWSTAGTGQMSTAALMQISGYGVIETNTKYADLKHLTQAQIYQIKENNASNTATVVVVANLSCGERFPIGSIFRIYPFPPASVHLAMEQSIEKWKLYEMECGQRQNVIECLVINYTKLDELYNGSISTMWRICLNTNGNDGLWKLLEPAFLTCYIGCNVTLKVNKNDHQMSQITKQDVTGRISRITTNEGTSSDISLEIYVMMNEKWTPAEGQSILKLWAMYSNKVPTTSNSNVPARAELNMNSNDNDEEDQLSIQFISMQLADTDKKDESLPKIIGDLLEYDPGLIKMYKMKKLLLPTLNNINAIASGWTERPVVPYPLIDFLKIPACSSQNVDHLIRLPDKTPRFLSKFISLRKTLDDSQKLAVDGMLINLIHATRGPPGTGKTFTGVTGAALVHCKDKGIILYSVSTNEGVDNAYNAMKQLNCTHNLGMRIVRMQSHTREMSNMFDDDPLQLHVMVKQHQLWRRYEETNEIIDKLEKDGPAFLTKKEAKTLQDHSLNITCHILMKTDIVFCTVPCAMDARLNHCLLHLKTIGIPLSATIIDEASLLSMCNMVSLFTYNPSRFWLIGDDKQLSITVQNQTAENACLNISYMEFMTLSNLVQQNNMFSQLRINYRMPKCSSNFISKYMYDGQLVSCNDVVNRKYKNRVVVKAFPEIGRNNCAFYASSGSKEINFEGSYYNSAEIDIVMRILRRLHKKQVDMSTVCVLTFYQQQVTRIKQAMANEFNVTVSTTDGFQGKQRSIVLLSMVRTDKPGFLRDKKRINVAFSRHENFIFVVGDVRSLSEHQVDSLKLLFQLHSEFEDDNVNVIEYECGKLPIKKGQELLRDFINH